MAEQPETAISRLRENRPNDPRPNRIPLYKFRTDNQVAALAQALRRNEYAEDFTFCFGDYLIRYGRQTEQEGSQPILNWDPLLRELEARDKLSKIEIVYTPRGNIVLLFRDQFFQALQRNDKLQSLRLGLVSFRSNNSDGFVSFLDDTPPSFTDLKLDRCRVYNGSDGITRRVAMALHRNNRIQSLNFVNSQDAFLGPIFQSLASSDSASCLKTIVFQASFVGRDDSVPEAIRQYLESSSATVQSLELSHINFYPSFSGASHILRGLSRNTSVSALTFTQCSIRREAFARDEGEEELQKSAKLLATAVQALPGLESLRFSGGPAPFDLPHFSDAVAKVLTKRESTLRCLDILVSENLEVRVPASETQTILAGVAKGTRLERLMIRGILFGAAEDHFPVIEEAIPLLKVTDLLLTFTNEAEESEEEALIESFRKNYSVKSAQCLRRGNDDARWFSDANQARLEFYLSRNQKLAQWTDNPKLVPPKLWSYAVNLALEAGINPLFQSLLALSGLGVGLKKGNRKRKCS